VGAIRGVLEARVFVHTRVPTLSVRERVELDTALARG
jgi:hypothetical protein